jgi:hypothetical protein
MSTRWTCWHELDWDSAEIADEYHGGCTVILECRHCSESAFADLGPAISGGPRTAGKSPRTRAPGDAAACRGGRR